MPKKGRHDEWGFGADEQRTRTYLGLGEEDINLHDQWAVESMGAIQDRTREHLGYQRQGHHGQPAPAAEGDRDRAGRRRAAHGAVGRRGGGVAGPDTMDCIAPAYGWQAFWQEAAAAKRAGAAWLQPAAVPATEE